MPMRKLRRSDQFTSRQAGSVVLSIGAVVLMIICLVVVITLWDTQNKAPAAPKSENDGRDQLTADKEHFMSSYNYPASDEPKVTHTMKMAPERDGLRVRESDNDDIFEQSMCPVFKKDKDKEEYVSCTVSGTICDCTSRWLTQIPTRLAESVQCTTLLLGNNCLRAIPPDAFADFTELEILDLRDNEIATLNTHSFQGISKLRSLYLQGNILPMDESIFIPGIFRNLSSLTSLDISRNNKFLYGDSLMYPGVALSDLKKLQELTMDGLYRKDFTDEFRSLSFLRYLKLGGPDGDYCNLDIVSYETFMYLQQIQTLNISNCLIRQANFDRLENLVSLDISWNEKLGVETIFSGLHNQPITFQYLYANHVTLSYASSTSITTADAGMLPRGLRYIEARGNGFENVEAGVFKALPENLTYLDVSDNRFVFGAYLANVSSMANLETLLLNGANVVYDVPTSYPSSTQSGSCASLSASMSETRNAEEKLVFQLPPKLKRLSMVKAGLSYRLTEISFNSSNSLQELNLDQNVFSELKGPLYGLDRLTSLSMSGCSVKFMTETFFQNLTSLERLDLSDNLIGFHLPEHKSVSIFKDLAHLKYLNLSFNALRTMKPARGFLKGVNNLEELHMHNNRLWNFNIDISNLTKLSVMDLSSNFLSTLNNDVTTFIEGLVTKSNTSVLVDVSHNEIKCDCSNLDFLKWLSHSKAVHESLLTGTYLCFFPDLNVLSDVTDGYASVIGKLTRECTPRYVLFLFSLFGTLLLVSFVLGLILYRFRWNLRYMYYAAYLSVKKRGQPVVIEEDYLYDVFLSYARPDEQFIVDKLCPALETRGLKLHVHGRDFLVGDYIASNIVRAVKESRKTLVVLTRALLESTWCNYEIQMAIMESVHTGRPVLIFLIKESVSNRQLGQNLLSHIRNNTYIPYPESGPAQEPGNHLLEAFWDKLAADLKS